MARSRRRQPPRPRLPYLVTPRRPPEVPDEQWFDDQASAEAYALATARRHGCPMTLWRVRWGRRGQLEDLIPVQRIPGHQPPGPLTLAP